MAGKPQSGGASPADQPLGLGHTVLAGLAEGLLDLGVVKVCLKEARVLIRIVALEETLRPAG